MNPFAQVVPVNVGALPLSQIITWIIIGIIAGIVAGRLVWGRQFVFWRAAIIGLLGALLGGVILSALNIRDLPAPFNLEITIRLIDVVAALLGAVIIVLVARYVVLRDR